MFDNNLLIVNTRKHNISTITTTQVNILDLCKESYWVFNFGQYFSILSTIFQLNNLNLNLVDNLKYGFIYRLIYWLENEFESMVDCHVIINVKTWIGVMVIENVEN